jgi:hypothetical protein
MALNTKGELTVKSDPPLDLKRILLMVFNHSAILKKAFNINLFLIDSGRHVIRV